MSSSNAKITKQLSETMHEKEALFLGLLSFCFVSPMIAAQLKTQKKHRSDSHKRTDKLWNPVLKLGMGARTEVPVTPHVSKLAWLSSPPAARHPRPSSQAQGAAESTQGGFRKLAAASEGTAASPPPCRPRSS